MTLSVPIICFQFFLARGEPWACAGRVHFLLIWPFRLVSNLPHSFSPALQMCCAPYLRLRGGDYLQNYLDDFLVMGPPNSPACQLQLDACLATCKHLGVPIAAEKTEGPSSCITYLGFLLNTAELTISLPLGLRY